MRKKYSHPDYREEVVELIKKIDLPDREMAACTNTFYTTVGRWRRGEVSPSRRHYNMLKRIEAGQVNVKEPSLPYLASEDVICVPIFAKLPASLFPKEVEKKKSGHIYIHPLILGGNYKDCYILKVEDDSMQQIAYQGSWAVICESKEPQKGDWLIFSKNKGYTFREWSGSADTQSLSRGVVLWIIQEPYRKTTA